VAGALLESGSANMAILFIVLGCGMILVGVIGCIAVVKENTFLLKAVRSTSLTNHLSSQPQSASKSVLSN